jgi:hypothetical protein
MINSMLLLLERTNIVLASMQKEIKGILESLFESCNSYAQAHKYLEGYLHQQKGDQLMKFSAVALSAF